MIKRIPVADLIPGMFVHDLACDWLTHPFLRNRFKLTSAAQIARIVEAGIEDVFIDVSRGLDVQGAAGERGGAITEASSAAAGPGDDVAVLAPERTTTRPALDTPPPRIFTLRGSALDEMTRARSVYEEATRFVAQAMESARVEGQLDLRGGAELIERMTESIGRNSGALLSLCKVQDPARYHHLHSVSVCALTIALSHALGDTLQQTHEIGLGGLLHDIGMALVPDRILEKPGKLTEREYAEVRRHPAISFKLLDAVPGVSATMLRMALDHHERLDGSGYPRKLAGDAISREGRIAAVCDVYDAMTAQRRWNRATPPSRALRTLLEFSDRHFCKETVQAFIRAIGVYPAGSLVRLESERLAIVLEQSPGAPLEPLVRIVYDAKRDRYLPPEDLDLHGKPSDRDPIVKYEDPLKWGIDTRRFI